MNEQPDATWFIWTGGNRLADNMIADTEMIGPEDECREMLCADNEKRDLVRCPDYQFVRVFEEAAKSIAPVHYKIFCKEGPNAPIKERPSFMDPRRRGKSSAARRTRAQLAQKQPARPR